MKTARRNARYEDFVANVNGNFILELSDSDGKDIAKFKLDVTDIEKQGRNIYFKTLPKSEKAKLTGTINRVRIIDKDGGILINDIPFASDGRQPFRFRPSLDCIEGENVRFTDGLILLHKISVNYKNRIIWTWK